MIEHLDNFYLNKIEPNKSCLLALRQIVLNHNKEFSETIKYGMPCFIFKKKIVCYLRTDKKTDEPYVLFAEGKKIDHPKLEMGARSKMKIFRINPNEDIPLQTLQDILKLAMEVYKSNSYKIE